MYIGLLLNCPFFLSHFNQSSILSTDFRKTKKISHLRLVKRGQTDGRTDITKLTVAFQNFAKAHKNQSVNAV